MLFAFVLFFDKFGKRGESRLLQLNSDTSPRDVSRMYKLIHYDAEESSRFEAGLLELQLTLLTKETMGNIEFMKMSCVKPLFLQRRYWKDGEMVSDQLQEFSPKIQTIKLFDECVTRENFESLRIFIQVAEP
jgi:hypothetical protein